MSSSSSLALPPNTTLLLLALCASVWSYEAPEERLEAFAQWRCPAFLTFTNVAILSRSTVSLRCRCKPPQVCRFYFLFVQSVVWFYRKHLGGSGETRVFRHQHGNQPPASGPILQKRRVSIRLFSLVLFRAEPDNSGIYICGSANNDFFSAYDLDVQEARSISFAPRFTSWSVCDRCGMEAEQMRVGLCYVHSRFLHVRYIRANETVASCGSRSVPRAFSRVRGGRAQLEVRRCRVTCPPRPAPSSKFQALMSFLGVSSSSQPVDVPVFYLSHPAGTILTLACPGVKSGLAVAWDAESGPIYRSEWLRDATSRLKVDTGHHLVFTPAETQDSGVLTCWLQGRPAAQIRLLVYHVPGQGPSVTSHPDFPLALRTVLTSYIVMSAVFILLLLGRAGLRFLTGSAQALH